MFSRDGLASLLAWEQGPCLSIYLKTARAGPDTRRNPIALKNALRDAKELLKARGAVDRQTHEAILSPLESWQQDTELHQNLDHGLAIFLAPGFSRRLLSPEAFDFHIAVGDAFYIRPLLPLLARERDFLLLALNRENVRLYRGDGDGIREWKSQLPESWEKLRAMAGYQKQTGFHPSGPTPTTGGVATPKYHTYGESPDDLRKTQTDEFVRTVAKAAAGVRAACPNIPLLLCAGAELAGMFRQHYSGDGLLDSFIEANPAGLDEEELHERACAIVEPVADADHEDAATRLAALVGNDSDRVSTDISDVLAAATQGQVDTLFVARDAALPGQFDAAEQRAIMRREHAPDDVDLSDLAARETLRHGGAVFTPIQRDMPLKAPMAAIFHK